VAFPALSLFNLLRFPLLMLPSQINALVQGKVALDRIQKFLGEEEMEQEEETFSGDPAVVVKGAAFAWTKGGDPVLRDIALTGENCVFKGQGFFLFK
jgi:ATP-binding cassette, subfamily C (CFTR/MRP), member 1